MSHSISSESGAPDRRQLTRSERLDRLPTTKEHRKLLVGSGVGWALDAMDVGLISFIMAALKVQWDLSSSQLGFIGSIGFVGMALGATLGGLLADRIGRRNVFALTLLVYGLATGAAALSVSVTMLLVLRFLIGLGLGAELPVASTLVSEFAPTRFRGRMVVFLEAFWAVGWFAAALLGFFVVGASDNGWRWALAIGAVPALYALYIRHGLPESVRFLESKGRHAEAEAAVKEFEDSPLWLGTETRPGFPDGPDASTAAQRDAATVAARDTTVEDYGTGLRALFGRRLRRRTIGLWGVWFLLNFAYYGAFTWLPSLLVADGFTLTQSFGYTVIITAAQLPGYAVAAWLIEAWGRKPTLAVFLAGSAVGALLFSQSTSAATVIASGCVLSFFCLGAWGALYAVSPETYPTSIRGTGTGAASGFGRIASMTAPVAVPFFVTAGGTALAFVAFAAAFLLAAASALLLVEQRGRRLEA